MDANNLELIKSDLNNDFELTYELLHIHPEEGEELRLNNAFNQIDKDLNNLDKGFKNIADNIDYILKNTVERLDAVKSNINYEKERLQDIVILCNKYTDFDNVVLLSDSDFKGNYFYKNGLFSSDVISSIKLDTEVESVTGNGYEGNKYAYTYGEYISSSMDTSLRTAINDDSVASYYEYSRITASNTEEYLLDDFNTDSEEAKCSIVLSSKTAMNEIEILSEDEKTDLISVQYSKDGIDYEYLDITTTALNSKEDSYKDSEYIYGSGKICVPNSKKVKISLQSKGYTSDKVAFERKITDVFGTKIQDKTTVVRSGKRHVIKINDISCYQKTFALSAQLESKELIGNNAYSIAVFCNMYIPEGLSENSVKFILTVNGIDYDVVPINSNMNGIKVIRFSQGKTSPEYTKYIGEQIKSAILTIKLRGKSNASPYINNLKILLGGEI